MKSLDPGLLAAPGPRMTEGAGSSLRSVLEDEAALKCIPP